MIRLSDAATLFHADCRDAIKHIPSDSLDSCVTDPPYALVSTLKRFANSPRTEASMPTAGPYERASRGFMGQTWDTGETAFSFEFWAEVYRVLKPGAFVAAFGASRGYHRMTCAIEDAGFEIRDSLMWVYAVGFPKSHNLDNHDGFCRCGTCDDQLRSVWDGKEDTGVMVSSSETPDVLPSMQRGAARSGMEETRSQGTQSLDGEVARGLAAALHRPDQPVMERRNLPPGAQGQLRIDEVCSLSTGCATDGASGRLHNGTSLGHVPPLPLSSDTNGSGSPYRPQSEEQRTDESGTVAGQPFAQDGGAWPNCGRCGKPMVTRGLGSALKPAFEPIVLARKPLSEKTVAANVLRWRTGALNIDASRVPSEVATGWSGKGAGGNTWNESNNGLGKDGEARPVEGRWPANVVHDSSPEVVGAFPAAGGQLARARTDGTPQNNAIYGALKHGTRQPQPRNDSGSAARFFYSAKASKVDRNGSKHPTVKPIALMEWLATLITPPGGTILDPFAGSGTTGAAARNRGFHCVLVEREAEYIEDIKARFGFIASPPLAPPPY